MTTETKTLTDEQIECILQEVESSEFYSGFTYQHFARAIEQAVLQSPEVQALRDALENLLNVREGRGGTAYPADEIARAALARGEV